MYSTTYTSQKLASYSKRNLVVFSKWCSSCCGSNSLWLGILVHAVMHRFKRNIEDLSIDGSNAYIKYHGHFSPGVRLTGYLKDTLHGYTRTCASSMIFALGTKIAQSALRMLTHNRKQALLETRGRANTTSPGEIHAGERDGPCKVWGYVS
jgi:hypothetical protein